MQKQKLQKKQSVSFEVRLEQSLMIGVELVVLYAFLIITFGWWKEPFEDQQTRAFGLLILPTMMTLTIHAFRVAWTGQRVHN